MLREQRRNEMEQFIIKRQNVSMEELCAHFGVSLNTVRADVAELCRRGGVRKIYGGAQSVTPKPAPLFSQRALTRTGTKRAIAMAAARHIENGDILYIDAGTTTMHLMEFLPPSLELTIITANIYLIDAVLDKPGITLVVLPGILQRRTNSLMDNSTVEVLGRYQCSKAFLGVSGITEDGRLNVSSFAEQALKQAAVRQSRQTILLADSLKFGEYNLLSYGSLREMDLVITDDGIPPLYEAYCESHAIPLETVSLDG